MYGQGHWTWKVRRHGASWRGFISITLRRGGTYPTGLGQAVWLGIFDGDLYKAFVISTAAKPSFNDAQTISGTSHCFEMLRAICSCGPKRHAAFPRSLRGASNTGVVAAFREEKR